MTLNERIVIEAKTWLGVPYKHMGTRKTGCDCTGFLLGVARSSGFLTEYKMRKYPKDWNLHGMADDIILRELQKVSNRIRKKEAIPGDVLVFKWGRCESHVGILLENKTFIHITKNSNCNISSLKDSIHFKRWVATFRADEDLIGGYHE